MSGMRFTPRGYGGRRCDSEQVKRAGWQDQGVLANPPFRLAEQFIHRALGFARIDVAMLVRTSFLESQGRYERLYNQTPPSIVAQYVERVPMVKGRLDPKASTATSYAWLVWLQDWEAEPGFRWIPPCRKALEREGDYAPRLVPPVRQPGEARVLGREI